MKLNLEIKQAKLPDLEALRVIGRKTFIETFADLNSAENMKQYLDEGFDTEKLTEELSNENSEFYFAVLDEQVIGYLKINMADAQTELESENSLEIERIYILKEFFGKNVGQILLEKALEIARNLKNDYVWLGVWELNARAISFYKKYGFIEFDKHVFILGDDHQTDIMMKLDLNS